MAISFLKPVASTGDTFRSTGTVTSFTQSFNAGTGTNLFGLFTMQRFASQSPSAVTFNGAALTQLNTYHGATSGSDMEVWYIFSPASGTNTFEVDYGTAQFVRGVFATYAGVKQSGFPDNTSTLSDNAGAVTTNTLTPVASNCWGIQSFIGSAAVLSTVNSTIRSYDTTAENAGSGDTNATISGSTTMTTTFSGGSSLSIMFSVAPAPIAPTPQIVIYPITFL